MPTSSKELFLMKISSSLLGLELTCWIRYSAAEFVTKLNLKHNIFRAVCLFDTIASIIDFRPLSRILL